MYSYSESVPAFIIRSKGEENISVDLIVKIMHEKGISSLSQVAELLGVSYVSVLEPLRLNVHLTQNRSIE